MTFTMGPAILFCPADRPERYAKAADRADAVILDLEDAVAPEAKAAAREALVASSLDPARTIVRVNAAGSPEFAADVAALRQTPYRTVMLAKSESAADVTGLAGYDVVALLETARGVVNAGAIAAADGVVALMWGAEDLIASMGGTSSRSLSERGTSEAPRSLSERGTSESKGPSPSAPYRDIPRQARAMVALAAAAHDRAMIDAVHLDIADVAGLRAEADDARACGFVGSACIHPSQVDVIRAAFAPTEAELAWAHRVLAAAEAAGSGVFAFEGRMVDEPVLRHARSLLARSTTSA